MIIINLQFLGFVQSINITPYYSWVLSEAPHTCLSRLPQKLLKGDCLDIGTFALVLDDVEYQCFFVMRKLVVVTMR